MYSCRAIVCLLLIEITSGSPSARKRSVLHGVTPLPRAVITQSEYTAAVYSQQLSFPVSGETRAEALVAINLNLDIYQQQAILAQEQGVDILVFPEYGITLGQSTRQGIKPALETIPDPKDVDWNPCLQPNRYNNTEIQHRLSCMARNASLYLVAAMGDIQPCSSEEDMHCPHDGVYQYNTDVAFDPQGNLVARYHKRNLFYERNFDYPPIELVTFDTPFGRFALFTCFDSIFYDPSVAVIRKYQVDSIAYPTAWVETPPLFSAIQWQAAFATGLNVNFLASNHYDAGGSGIYTPTGPVKYVTNYQPGQLIVGKVPSRPTAFPEFAPQLAVGNSSDGNVFQRYLFHDLYNFVEVDGLNGTSTVCQNSFCCTVDFSRSTQDWDVFALGVFFGQHAVLAQDTMQACIIIQCPGPGRDMCGEPPFYSYTTFNHLVLSGNFTTQYVFPELLVYGDGGPKLPENGSWRYFNGTIQSPTGFTDPVMSMILLGRFYDGRA